MAYQLVQTPSGQWFAVDVSAPGVAFGPFPHRGAAVDEMTARSVATERQECAEAARARAAFSDEDMAQILAAEIAKPSPAPRGRPVPDNPRGADIAFEYYWLISKSRGSERLMPAAAVAAVVRSFNRGKKKITADYVRKVRAEYSPVATYDNHLLGQLRAQAFQRRNAVPEGPTVRKRKADAAQDWLRRTLLDGPMRAQEVFQLGEVQGFPKRTLERAKKALRIASARGGRLSSWQLPDT